MGESRKYLLAKINVEKSCKIKLAPQNAGPLFRKYFLKKRRQKTAIWAQNVILNACSIIIIAC